jgi:tetratricopeptide (TPR) repeat protein
MGRVAFCACDEAKFFVEQGLFEEAKEILETVQIAYPGHARAAELMAQIAAAEAGNAPAAEASAAEDHGVSNGVSNGAEEGKDAFDLAAELANELGEMEEAAPSEQAEVPSEDFQYSVEEVFADFKKGLEKVVKPEDVDTHYDLGIAYKEMGLIDDAIGEFKVAQQGAIGKRKEVDCLSMMAALQMMKGDSTSAIDSYLSALANEHAGTPEVEKALRYELAGVYETAGSLGKALSQFMKVKTIDGNYREVDANVARLSEQASPEDDAPAAAPKKKGGGGQGSAPASRKVGYL